MGKLAANMDKLSEIMAAKRKALEGNLRPVRDQELERLGRMQSQGGSFLDALARKDRLVGDPLSRGGVGADRSGGDRSICPAFA